MCVLMTPFTLIMCCKQIKKKHLFFDSNLLMKNKHTYNPIITNEMYRLFLIDFLN